MAMKKILTALLCAGLLLLPSLAAGAIPDETRATWNVPFLGELKVPEGFAAVEVKDFRQFVDQEKMQSSNRNQAKAGIEQLAKFPPGTPVLLQEAIPQSKDSAEERLRQSDFALYHLTLNDGKAIHTAWFLAARDAGNLSENVDLFTKALTPEQSQKLDELKSWIDANIDKAEYKDPKGKVDLKLIEVLPIQPISAGAGQMWTSGARCLITVDDLPFAFFGKVYLLNLGGHLAGGVLAGFDGERPFWDPVLDESLASLAASGKQTNE